MAAALNGLLGWGRGKGWQQRPVRKPLSQFRGDLMVAWTIIMLKEEAERGDFRFGYILDGGGDKQNSLMDVDVKYVCERNQQ